MTTHRARQLPVHRGVAAWSAILGPWPEYPALTGARTADFVVVGGGFAGLSAARRLIQLQPTARVVLLEAGRIAEITLSRLPVVLGAGRPLFAEGGPTPALRHLGTRSFPSGIVQSRYAVG